MNKFLKLLPLLVAFPVFSLYAQKESSKEYPLKYIDLIDYPVVGQMVNVGEYESRYDRLPLVLKDSIREELWNLGKNSAGVGIRFKTDSRKITARWEVLNNMWMNHMTPTGIKGLDLYGYNDGHWIFIGSARPQHDKSVFKSTFISNMDGTMREYLLYLPLYDCATKVEIGIDSAAIIEQPEIEFDGTGKPIVVYGTSVTQGGCATRPGMVYTSILSRKLDREFINLGFSGNGRLDPEIARLMAKQDASLYILDNMANCTTPMLDRLPEFVDILKSAHPQVPILLLGNARYTYERFDTVTSREVKEKEARLVELFHILNKKYKDIYYLPGHDMIGDDDEATVDGTHFTDLGFLRMSEALEPEIRKLLFLEQK